MIAATLASNPSGLDADVAWHERQAAQCADALATLAAEAESPSRTLEMQIVVEAMGRYQATLEHLLRLKAMIERSGSAKLGNERMQ